jgi:hypothetical protein
VFIVGSPAIPEITAYLRGNDHVPCIKPVKVTHHQVAIFIPVGDRGLGQPGRQGIGVQGELQEVLHCVLVGISAGAGDISIQVLGRTEFCQSPSGVSNVGVGDGEALEEHGQNEGEGEREGGSHWFVG